MVGHSDFHVELSKPPGGGVVVAPCGELDLYTSPEFESSLTRALDEGGRRVIADLTQVTFMASSALGVLIGAARRSARESRSCGSSARPAASRGSSRSPG